MGMLLKKVKRRDASYWAIFTTGVRKTQIYPYFQLVYAK
jgi:hypothetical protein